jgi:hypothetical protein
MTPKRPRDPNQLAKRILDIATGETPDRDPTPEEEGKDPAAVALGKKGGKARADSMTPEQRAEIARKYAIGKGHSVIVLWRGGEVDSIFGFASEHEALEWIRDKSQGWLLEQV